MLDLKLVRDDPDRLLETDTDLNTDLIQPGK
jgi:hypothetical protein